MAVRARTPGRSSRLVEHAQSRMPISLDIPELGPEASARAPVLDYPFFVWGSVPRSTRAGTWSFYTDDYRFEALWQNPSKLVDQRSAAALEPNYSVFDDTPRAVAIWAIYRKRYLARHWQERGIRIWVDLCVSHKHSDLTLLGVPRGWQRYATRGFDARVSDLDFELRQARRHADGAPFALVVYGGGKATQAWCAKHPEVIRVPAWNAARLRPGEGSRRAAMRAAHRG